MEEEGGKRLDLHIHSIYSDGHWTPAEIVKEAKDKGIEMIAITDHDALEGYEVGLKIAEQEGVKLISGIELNADGELGEMHILGYLFDAKHPRITEHVQWRKNERLAWGRKIVEQLQLLGYSISFDDCVERAGQGVLVRTHIAEELVEAGYFNDQQAAYDRLLRKGQPAYVQREAFSAIDAIDLIHDAGGLAFLAHPGIYSFDVPLEILVKHGLDGIEVYHSKHAAETTAHWLDVANEHDLLISGGSDFHGPHSRNPYPIGSVKIQPSIQLEQWERRMAKR